ncbi:MAG: hypothetical protein KAR21_09980 [Spirochaetales bacterium]|nr:hypothetical protein [Spirochaetales bacterium]
MKLTIFLMAVVVILLLFGCASTGEVTEVVSVEETAEPVEEEVKKEPVKIITTVFFPVLEESYFGDGVKDEYRVFTYDVNGVLLLKEALFGADEVLQESIVYEYTGSESCMGSIYDAAGTLLSYRFKVMDADGNVLKKENFDNKNILQSRSEYEYEKGLKSSWMVYNASQSLLSTTNYIYTGNLLTRIESMGPGGDMEEYFELSYNSAGMLLENIHYNTDGEIEDSRSFEYKDGYLVMEKIHRKNGSVQRKIMYINDQFGNPVETVFMDSGDNVNERVIRVFESREEISYED